MRVWMDDDGTAWKRINRPREVPVVRFGTADMTERCARVLDVSEAAYHSDAPSSGARRATFSRREKGRANP